MKSIIKKIKILLIPILLTGQVYAETYHALLGSNNFTVSTSISTPLPPVEGGSEDSAETVSGGIDITKLFDGVWECSSAGTSTSQNIAEVALGSPVTINYIDSAGMGRLWKHPLKFEGLTQNGYILLGYIQTSGYCLEAVKTRITFPALEITGIRISTPEKIYIGELGFGFLTNP